MCLILFSYKSHPRYKLVVAANRDEFYDRPTRNAGFWEDEPNILAGRDIEAGGTWMGVNTSGKISMLTNFRDPFNVNKHAPTRGYLVSEYLKNKEDPELYLKNVEAKGTVYNGFNLICGTADTLYYYGNYQKGVRQVEPGIHGLSNALLNSSWPKVEKGKQRLSALLSDGEVHAEPLLEMLYDTELAGTNLLPETGVGVEMEKMLSPMFIRSEYYGSRCSTVIFIDYQDRVSFVERTYNTNDLSSTTLEFEFHR